MINALISILFIYLPFQVAINPAEGIDLASIRIIIPIIFLLWLIEGLKNKKLIISQNKTTFFIFSFLFICGFSLMVATNVEWGLRKFFFLLSIVPLYFVVTNIPENKMVSIFKFVTLGSFLAALIGIFQFSLQFILGINEAIHIWGKTIVPFLGNTFSEAVLENSSWLVNASGHTLLRAIAFFPDPHMFSFYLGMTAPIALALYLKLKNNRFFYLISFFTILIADFLTFSRGGYLGVIVGLFFGIIIFYHRNFTFSNNQIKRMLLVFSAIFILIIFSIMVPNPISNRLYSSFNLSEGSNTERIETWNNSLEVISENPLLGVGLGNYALSIKPSADYREPIYSHNAYMDIAAETGILGVFFWIFILVFSIIKSTKIFLKKNNIIHLGIASSLVVFSVHSVFETAIFSVHILPLLILLIGAANQEKDG